MKIALNEKGAIALEQLAGRLNKTSENLRVSFLNLKRAVNTEIDGTGILKGFFDNETTCLGQTIEELNVLSEVVAPRMLLTASKIRDYVGSEKVVLHRVSSSDQVLISALQRTIRKPTLPHSNGKWSDPEKPGNSVWMPNPEALFAWRDHGVVRLTPYKGILHKYNMEGVTYRFNHPVFDRFVDTNIGEVYLENMPDIRYGKKGAHHLADIAVTKNPQSIFYQKSPEEVYQYRLKNGVVWHEVEDMHTIQPIPKEINAAFKHTGAIGYKGQILKLAKKTERIIGKRWRLVKGKLKTSFSSTDNV